MMVAVEFSGYSLWGVYVAIFDCKHFVEVKGDYSRLASYKGEAAVEGWGKGGAIQYELSLTVEQLERLGLLSEIN